MCLEAFLPFPGLSLQREANHESISLPATPLWAMSRIFRSIKTLPATKSEVPQQPWEEGWSLLPISHWTFCAPSAPGSSFCLALSPLAVTWESGNFRRTKWIFLKVPKRWRSSTLLLGLSSQGFGVFGSKVRLFQSSLCIRFLCLCVWQSLLPQFADFVTMAFQLPPERTAAATGALTCVGREEKCFKAEGNAAFSTKTAPGALPQGRGDSPAPRSLTWL